MLKKFFSKKEGDITEAQPGQDKSLDTQSLDALCAQLASKATVLGVDYGARYTGLALGYWPDLLVVPLTTLESSSLQDLVEKLSQIIAERSVDYIVIGLPQHKLGHTSTANQNLSNLFHELAKAGKKPVYYWDERFTSQLAHRLLQDYQLLSQNHHKYNVRPKSRKTLGLEKPVSKNPHLDKASINQLAAAQILQSFLDFLSYKTQNRQQ